jgi:hypothetical protein
MGQRGEDKRKPRLLYANGVAQHSPGFLAGSEEKREQKLKF